MTSTTTNQITGFSGSLAVKQPVRLATTVPIVLEGLFAIDGVVPAEGDRILVKDQADASQNGIYIASSGLWSRAVDFDATGKVAKGTMTLVGDGPQVGLWMVTAADPVVLGLSGLSFGKVFVSAPLGPEDLAALIDMGDDEAFADTAMIVARKADGTVLKRSWANTLTAIRIYIRDMLGAMIFGVTAKASPIDGDLIGIADTAASNASKKITFLEAWTNYFKGKADALYQPVKTVLTTLGNLANGSGYLQNNGSGTLSWGAISGGQPIPSSSTFAVGTMILAQQNSGSDVANGGTTAGSNIKTAWTSGGTLAGGAAQTGTYTNRSGTTVPTTQFGTFSRTA